jgi:S-disulfanyl-L-cysteine oxidoreductase SoxD
MFSWRDVTLLLVLFTAGAAGAQTDRYPGIGRSATAGEIAAWDIDVRPDFKGLPVGAGSVAKGMQVWESQCASCHGFFGESNEFFSPVVGGTTPDDIKTGRVARLNDPSFPGRTTLMKLPTVSTLWDYIRRAMPWTQPKSLSTEEVYAVTAYILNLGGVVPDDFTLSDKNIAEVQQRLPNRNGMSTDHALWPGSSRQQPDVRATACMKDCVRDVTVASFLPDFARDAHGNLAEQNRHVGAQKGADTRRPAAAAVAATPTAPEALLRKHHCVACHGPDNRIVGPSWREISAKYVGAADAQAYLGGKIKSGGVGVWGSIAMPAQTIGQADAAAIAQWLVQGVSR